MGECTAIPLQGAGPAAMDLVRRARQVAGSRQKLNLLAQAVELAPASLRARIALARALADCGREHDAVFEWERALAAARALQNRGRATRYAALACRELAALLWRTGKAEDAGRLHQQAIRFELRRRRSLSERTLLNAALMGTFDSSSARLAHLLRVIAGSGVRRERADAWLRLGRLAAGRHDLPAALVAFRRSVRAAVGPRARGEALGWYGCLLARAGKLRSAARILRRGSRRLEQAHDRAGAERLLRLACRVQAARAQQQRTLIRN